MNGRYGYWHQVVGWNQRVKKPSVWEANCNNKRYITGTQRECDGSRLRMTFWVLPVYVQNMS